MIPVDPNTPPAPPDYSPVDPNARPGPYGGDSEWVEPPEIPITTPAAAWSKEIARKVVVADFLTAASWRATNIEPRWQESHDTYVAATGAAPTWEGTVGGTPRANTQSFQAFQQINALRPQMLDAFCGADLDFDVEAATAGTTIGQLHSVRALMQYQLKNIGGPVKFQSFRSCLDRLTEDGLIYANGIWEWGWDGPRTEQVVRWQKVTSDEQAVGYHPAVPGVPIHYKTGRQITSNHRMYQQQTISRFMLDPVDLTDFYIDPNCRGANVQLADYVVRRKMMTIAELAELRGQPSWDIPSDQELYVLAHRKWSTEGDSTREYMQSSSGVSVTSQQDQSRDPRLARIEVLRYWQKSRHVWLLGRSHVAWNSLNQYAALPFFNWCYVNKPGAFYGFSIPELLRTDQRIIKTLMDGRLDELNLILHPQTIVKRGLFRSQSQNRMRPGAVIEADDPGKDYIVAERPNVTQQAFIEVDAAETRGQKKTGVTDLVGFGTPAAGGNSANRTATGVQAQTNAGNSRVHGLVAQVEDTVCSPMFESMWRLSCMYLDPQQVVAIVGPDGQALNLSPVDILNADPRFKFKTANNMKMRAAMQNGGLQQITQILLNPEIAGPAEMQGKILDIPGFIEFALDVYNVKASALMRDMTPQEQQAMAQRNQQKLSESLAVQNARLQNQNAVVREQDDTKTLIAFIAALVPALAQTGALHNVLGLEAPIQLEARRLEADIAGQAADSGGGGGNQ